MPRILKIGAGGDEIGWREALKDLRAEDVLILEPGFYELPQGITLTDVTLKGSGRMPEDTTILGYLNVSSDSRYVTLENLCLNTNKDRNTLFVPAEANTYLTLRNCIVKGYGGDVAAIAANGKVTLELYSTKVINGSISLFAAANFRLEMNDSVIDNVSDEYGVLAIEGKGTAIINNSRIHGSIDTFANANVELDINNSAVDYLLLHGQTWINLLNSQVLSRDDSSFYASDECWVNIVNGTFSGGVYLDNQVHMIMQNSTFASLIAVDQAVVTLNNSVSLAHTDFQDQASCSSRRSTFNGNGEFQYFLALSDQAKFDGRDTILNPNGAGLVAFDAAQLNLSVLTSSEDSVTVEYNEKPKVNILGLKWQGKKVKRQ